MRSAIINLLATQAADRRAIAAATERKQCSDKTRALRQLDKWEGRCLRMRQIMTSLVEDNKRKQERIVQLTKANRTIRDIECALTLAKMSEV